MAAALEPLRVDPSHSAVLLDVDGTLAPIVRHADDAHVPEPTRVPLIAIAKRAEEGGFIVHWGRKVLEIRPPVELNKGRGVERLLDGASMSAAMYVGDDSTDVDAFESLKRLTAEGHLQIGLCVGVRSDETPRELEAQADLLVDGPHGVRTLLSALAA